MADVVLLQDYPQKRMEQPEDLDTTQEYDVEEIFKQENDAIRSWTKLMSEELPALPENSLIECLLRRHRRLQEDLKAPLGLFARRRIERQMDDIMARLEKMGYSHPTTGFIPIASSFDNR